MPVSISISPSLVKEIDTLAEVEDRTRSYMIKEAISQYLDYHRWKYAHLSAAVAYADRPDADFIDHEDVAASLDAS